MEIKIAEFTITKDNFAVITYEFSHEFLSKSKTLFSFLDLEDEKIKERSVQDKKNKI